MKISLKAARVNAALTQKEAAKMLNVAVATISNWENGKTSPSVQKAIKIQEIYGIAYDEIIFLFKKST